MCVETPIYPGDIDEHVQGPVPKMLRGLGDSLLSGDVNSENFGRNGFDLKRDCLSFTVHALEKKRGLGARKPPGLKDYSLLWSVV